MLQKSLQSLKLGLRMRYPALTRTHSFQTNLPALLTLLLSNRPSNTFCSQQSDNPVVSPPISDNSLTTTNEIAIKIERSDFGDFSQKIESKLPVIDKTAYLYKLLNQRNPIFVMGPESFGKTFNLTTMQAIFQNGKTWWETHCSNLAIVKDFHYEFPQHPVLLLDFSKVSDISNLRSQIGSSLKTLIKMADLEQELASYRTKYDEDRSSQALLNFFWETIIKVSRKYHKGVVILIDEYQTLRTSSVLKLRAQKSTDGKDQKELSEIAYFLKCFFKTIQELRVRGHDQVNYIRLELLTGMVPMRSLTSFSGEHDMFNTWQNEEFKRILGYTENEILETFGNHLEDMALKEFSAREKNKIDDLDEAKNEKIMRIRKSIENDIWKSYNGLRFSYDQEHALYCPEVMNTLFENWKTTLNLQFPPLCADSEQSQLIWKVVKIMLIEMKLNFLWALLDEQNSQSVFTCSKDQLLMNQNLENLNFRPEEIYFFTGVVSVQKNQSSQNLWSLGFVNNEMRKTLLQQLENQMGSSDSVVNTIGQVTNGHFRDYLSSVYKRLASLSYFTKISLNQCGVEKYAECYRPTLFEVVHNQIVKFAQDKQIKKKFGIKNFEFIQGEEVSCSEFLVYFETEKKKRVEKKVLVITEVEFDEFKKFEELDEFDELDIKDFENIDEETMGEIADKVQGKFEEKSQIREEMREKYAFLEDYQRVWIVALMESGQLQHAILYKEDGGGENKDLFYDATFHF